MSHLSLLIVGTASEETKDTVRTAFSMTGLFGGTPSPNTPNFVLSIHTEANATVLPLTEGYHFRYVWTDTSTADELVDAVRQFLFGADGEKAAQGVPTMARFTSTRGDSNASTFLSVVRDGLAKDGGLYMLKRIPVMPPSQLRFFCKTRSLNYVEAAQTVLEMLVDRSMTPANLFPLVLEAYNSDRWSDLEDVCPVTPLLMNHGKPEETAAWMRDVSVMELFHGPTAAFKDFALQLFPRYFNTATEDEFAAKTKTAEAAAAGSGAAAAAAPPQRDQYMIVAATSGDTGVAAISGFVNAGGKAKVMILYPMSGVSPVQQLQMLSFDDGTRVRVFGLPADFDFCQSTVKTIFADRTLGDRLAQRTPPLRLSSANSINWGRLIPQVVYYFWAYRQHEQRRHSMSHDGWHFGDPIDVVVPCGNFGNILAGYVAKLMGLPIRKLIVASNKNDVLYEFVETGVYDIRSRELQQTASPSIDILKASNVERFLYLLSDGDTALVGKFMRQLDTEGRFEVTPAMRARMAETFCAGRCDEMECAATIQRIYNASNHERLLDPHTAVAVAVAKSFREHELLQQQLGQPAAPLPPLVIASTAHWAKFPEPVLHAIRGEPPALGEPAATPAAAVEHVRVLYDQVLATAQGSSLHVHPALAAALRVAQGQSAAPRAAPAEVAAIVSELETFAAA